MRNPSFSLHLATAPDLPPEGTRRTFDQVERVFYCGHWIKTYPVPTDTLRAKKVLIEALTRRLFNHTEHGLNVPGVRLDAARAAFEAECDPDKRRVKGAMVAGALFNRAADIFRRLVDLEGDGVTVRSDYPLVQECGRCLMEALELGKLVQHRSGEEGIDELWGEPFRLFSSTLDAFFEGRYMKMGMAMRDIDEIEEALVDTFHDIPLFVGVRQPVLDFAAAARLKTETLRNDPNIFEVWASFVTAGERLANFAPTAATVDAGRAGAGDGERVMPVSAAQLQSTHDDQPPPARAHSIDDGGQLLRNGRALIYYVARVRTSMPKSTREFIERCEFYRRNGRLPSLPAPLPD